MTTAILIWTAVSLLFLVGIAGTIIPGVPGISLVFLGILTYGLATDFAVVTVTFIVIAGIIAALGILADYACAAWGSRAGGGTWKAAGGAVLGVIVGGVLAGPIGIFAGAFAGAAVGAAFEGHGRADALRIAAISTVGIVGSTLVQLLLAVSLILGFGAAFVL